MQQHPAHFLVAKFLAAALLPVCLALPWRLRSAPSMKVVLQKAPCGIVMTSSGLNYSELALRVATRSRSLNTMKGWCPLDHELDHIPVTLFTDQPIGNVDRSGGSMHGVNVQELPHIDPRLTPSDPSAAASGLKKNLGSWLTRWFHAKSILMSPYDLTLYVDVDALPCTGRGVAQLMYRVTSARAAVGAQLHTRSPCAMTNNNCADPHPPNLKPAEMPEWTQFIERNGGVLVVDMRQGRPLVQDYADAIARMAGKVKGDQYALREALFNHRHQAPQVIFRDDEVCRYNKNAKCGSDAGGGCAVHHFDKMQSLVTYGVVDRAVTGR